MNNKSILEQIHPVKWLGNIIEEFYEYEGQDKKAERDLKRQLKPLFPFFTVRYNEKINKTQIIIKYGVSEK